MLKWGLLLQALGCENNWFVITQSPTSVLLGKAKASGKKHDSKFRIGLYRFKLRDGFCAAAVNQARTLLYFQFSYRQTSAFRHIKNIICPTFKHLLVSYPIRTSSHTNCLCLVPAKRYTKHEDSWINQWFLINHSFGGWLFWFVGHFKEKISEQ